MPLLETVPQVGVAQRVDRRSFGSRQLLPPSALLVHSRSQSCTSRSSRRRSDRVQFQVQTPETGRFGGFFALSPNGRMMAFVAMVADEPHLWVHSFETGQSRPLLNAGSVSNAVFWSPDSRFLAFPIEGKLKKISVVGEQVQTVCDLPPGSTYGGGAWNAENVIVFGGSAGLMQVPAEGGVATPVTVLDRSRGDHGTSRAKVPSRRPAPPVLPQLRSRRPEGSTWPRWMSSQTHRVSPVSWPLRRGRSMPRRARARGTSCFCGSKPSSHSRSIPRS